MFLEIEDEKLACELEAITHFDVKWPRIKGKCTAAEPAREPIVVYRKSVSHEFADREANQPGSARLERSGVARHWTHSMIRGTRYGAGYRKLKKVFAAAEVIHVTMPKKKSVREHSAQRNTHQLTKLET